MFTPPDHVPADFIPRRSGFFPGADAPDAADAIPSADELSEEDYEMRFHATMESLGGRSFDLFSMFYALTEQIATSNAYLRVLTSTLARLEAEAEGETFEAVHNRMHDLYMKHLRHERLLALNFLKSLAKD
jgi:hypothetical protein